MDLFRDEYEARRPRAWGLEIYERLKKRGKADHHVLAPRPLIKAALEQVPTDTGPVDATSLMETFSDDDLCDFFMRVPKCNTLKLGGWRKLSDKVFRCISMHMGSSITDLDLSESHITSEMLEIMCTNLGNIKVLRINRCPKIDSSCMMWFARVGSSTIKELHAECVPSFRYEPLLTMCGFVGLNPPKVKHLRVLDLNNCPLEDQGLSAIASCNHHIKHLNLAGCSLLTDKSLVALISVSKHLEVVNLSGLVLCGNRTVVCLSSHCADNITSLNLNGMSKCTDDSIIRLANRGHKLQALNLAGMRLLTENVLAEICLKCPAILMVNVTGCGLISLKGLRAAVQGLSYVEVGETFFGFKPVDEHVEKKLSRNLEIVMDTAANRIIHGLQNSQAKVRMRKEFAIIKRDQSARLIQGCMTRYMCRQYFYKKYIYKLTFNNATHIQRLARGVKGRERADAQRDLLHIFRRNWPFALKIQKCFRGHKIRRQRFDIALRVRLMYLNRKVEAETGLAVRFQAGGRRFLTKQRIRAMMELRGRRGIDEDNAATMMQCFARVALAKMKVLKKVSDKARYHEVRDASATRIQHFYKAVMGHFKAQQSRAEQKMAGRQRWKAASLIDRVFRGHRGRQRVRRRKIKLAEKFWAAAQIQRIWRGSRIMYWRDMRINTIAAYVLDRQYLERKERIASSRMRYKTFLVDNRKDSASEGEGADEEPDDDWEERFDALAKRKYWYSKQNNIATYDEPKAKLANEFSLLFRRVRVFWVVQGMWYEGTITRFNKRKHRHKVEYDDGDTEWIDFDSERDRVQVSEEDGSWVMYLMYAPQGIAHEEYRKETENAGRAKFKTQAFEDAGQWDIIYHDSRNKGAPTPHPGEDEADIGPEIMWISNKSGEIRTGAEGCEHWAIQDDGHGFPCFFNEISGKVVYEDPRFIESLSVDMTAQRTFVMQELRYATYFCKELWERWFETTKGKNAGGRPTRFMANMIRKSDKPRHLVGFLVRARALYEPSSVVDAPSDPGAVKEIEYAIWLSERLAEIIEGAENVARQSKDSKFTLIQKLKAKGEKLVYCRFCTRETRRHLDYCPTCGKKQVDLIVQGDPDDPTLAIEDAPTGENDGGSLAGSVGGGDGGSIVSQMSANLFGGDDDEEEEEGIALGDDEEDGETEEGNEDDNDDIEGENNNGNDDDDGDDNDEASEVREKRVTFGEDQYEESLSLPEDHGSLESSSLERGSSVELLDNDDEDGDIEEDPGSEPAEDDDGDDGGEEDDDEED